MSAVTKKLKTWSGSLHQTFRLLPVESRSPNLRRFLEAHRSTAGELLERLPYDVARAKARGSKRSSPDPKRYRDGRQVYQTAGLLYEVEGQVRVTELGRTTLRWLDILNEKNAVILARHAAYALAACQLRNPTGAGSRYHESMRVFPFQFIWRAMLALDGRINSEELNRGLFKVQDEESLIACIEKIAAARRAGDLTALGGEVVTGQAKNDRLIPWMSLASFGWTIFPDKRGGEDSQYYELASDTSHIVKEASRIRHKHRDFASQAEYVEYVAASAALPRDVR